MNDPSQFETPPLPTAPLAPKQPHWTTPKLSPEQRARSAREWLIRCHQPLTTDRVERLAPYVGIYQPGSKKAKIANTLVREGREPDPSSVNAVLRRQRLKASRYAPTNASKAESVVDWISTYHSEHGTGPLWREVATQFGWDSQRTSSVLLWLRRQQKVWFTQETRSLKPLEATSKGPSLPTAKPRRREDRPKVV